MKVWQKRFSLFRNILHLITSDSIRWLLPGIHQLRVISPICRSTLLYSRHFNCCVRRTEMVIEYELMILWAVCLPINWCVHTSLMSRNSSGYWPFVWNWKFVYTRNECIWDISDKQHIVVSRKSYSKLFLTTVFTELGNNLWTFLGELRTKCTWKTCLQTRVERLQ